MGNPLASRGGHGRKIRISPRSSNNECDALAQIKEFDGITGKMTFTEEGDPLKCAVIVRISDKGEFEFYKSVCP